MLKRWKQAISLFAFAWFGRDANLCSKPEIGMCLEENYSDSPSNEYTRHYSAESESESEYLRRQNMNSK